MLPPRFKRRVAAVAGRRAADIDWDIVQRTGRDRAGVPVRVTVKRQQLVEKRVWSSGEVHTDR